jgi:acetyl coenzyme A synthetase (ADP forming)-like protein
MPYSMPMSVASNELERLFNPKSVAVIGASAKEGSIGFNLVQNLITSGYKGKIFPVNPKYESVLGEKCYGEISGLPIAPELSIVAIPAHLVNETVEEACRFGARMFIVVSSGFREIGRLDLEAELVKILKKHRARALGPNVFGVYSAKGCMNATFGPASVKPGNIALISQSGALGVALMGRSVSDNIGLSAVVSVGNEADITEREALAYLGNDENTSVIFLYMEGCRDGREFMHVANQVSKKKPIIAIKSGSSSRGALAAASHTGALAGSDRVFSAALKQSGVMRATSLDDAFNWVRAFANCPVPKKEGAVIITNGGGVGVMASDAAELYGVTLQDDLGMLERVFRPAMPEFGSTKNPVDITGQGRNKEYGAALEAGLGENDIPAIVGLYCTTATMDVTGFAKMTIETARRYKKNKPLVFSVIGGGEVPDAVRMLNDAGIPAYFGPEDAMSSMGAIYKRYRWLNTDLGKPEKFDIDIKAIQGIIRKAQDKGLTQLVESDCAEILRLAGLKFPKTVVARDLNEAIRSAEKIGYPVVLKILSPDIIHKTEYGCVKLNLDDETEVRVAYESIMAEARHHFPKARIEGVSVTEMITEATETILGFSIDHSFGPVIMFGMGGIYVEVLKDVSFGVAPLARGECMRMIRNIASYPILAGARGKEIRDLNSVAEAISRISYLAMNIEDILELDINPLMVMARGEGCKVVDSRMTIKGKVRDT